MPAQLIVRGTAIVWRPGYVAAAPSGKDMRHWRVFSRGRRVVTWQRTVVAGGAVNGNASGAPAAISLTAATGMATGDATASGAPAALTLTAALGSASGTGSGAVNGNASGAPAAITLTAAQGSATGTDGSNWMEPITLADAKLAARVDDASLDAYIPGVISAAREQAELITGRIYRRRVIRIERPDWPAANEILPVHEPSACAVSYWNGSTWAVVDTALYEFAPTGSGTEIAPALDTFWPTLGRKAAGNRVRIDFTAGPATPGDVAECVKLYCKAQVANWVQNPQAILDKREAISPLLAYLLDPERLCS